MERRRKDYSGQTLSDVIGTDRGGTAAPGNAGSGVAVFGATQCFTVLAVIGTDTLQLLCMGLIFTFWTGALDESFTESITIGTGSAANGLHA